MLNSEINKKTAKATRWSTITEIASKIVSPIVNMILARLLTPEAFGVVATITMVTSFAEIFADAGFQKYLVQHDFIDEEDLTKSTNVAFWTNLAISFFLWGIIFAFREPIAGLVGNSGLGNVIAIAALSLPLYGLSSIQMARFKRDFNFKSLFFVRLISMCAPFFVTLPVAFATRSYWALICGTLATNLLNAVFLTIFSKWKPRFYFSFSKLKEMFSYSWWILLESITNWLSSNIGTFIVGLVLTDYYLGLYKTSMTTVNQITALITAATSMPLFAALSRLKDDRESLFATYRQYIRAIALFVIPLGVGIWLYRDLVTYILLGDQWKEAADFVGLWGLTSSFSLVLGTYCNGLFNAKGKTYLSFFAQILHLVVLIPILIIFSREGYKPLYIARSLIRFEMVFVELILMGIALKFPVWRLFADLIPIFIGTGIMLGIDIGLQYISQSIIWQIISIVICILIYFVFFWLAYRKILVSSVNMLGVNPKDYITKLKLRHRKSNSEESSDQSNFHEKNK